MTTEEPRLKPAVWVAASMRTVQAAGAVAYLARRAPEGVGSVLIKQVTGRQATIFTPAYMADGRRGWLRGTGPNLFPNRTPTTIFSARSAATRTSGWWRWRTLTGAIF